MARAHLESILIHRLRLYKRSIPENNPELKKQVKISLVADFDPFQGSDITTEPSVFTMQFMHQFGLTADGKKRNESDSFWWLANEKV